MRVLDVLNAPWAIQPEKFFELQEVYLRRARGEKPDLALLEAQLGRPLQNERKPLQVIQGVAILPVEGILAKKMNLFTAISGGTSLEILAADFRAALADPAVHSILLQVDSPGGTVDGTQEMARLVRESRGVKPILALADGLMASAAYWIGSAADAISLTGETTAVGSIGVIATHVDISRRLEMEGVKETNITAGKFKDAGADNRPLEKQDRMVLQEIVDQIYSTFVRDVARNRRVSVETVLAEMADGRLFFGERAIEAGVVDGFATQQQLIEDLNRSRQVLSMSKGNAGAKLSLAGAVPNLRDRAAIKEATMDPITMTQEELNAKLEAALTEGAATASKATAEACRIEFERGQVEGARLERERIQAVEAAALPGHEALVEQMKFDGKTSGPEAKARVFDAEKARRQRALGDLKAEAPKPVPAAAAPENAATAEASLPIEERCKLEWERSPELRAEFTSLTAYSAFRRAEAAGRVRVLEGKSRPA